MEDKVFRFNSKWYILVYTFVVLPLSAYLSTLDLGKVMGCLICVFPCAIFVNYGCCRFFNELEYFLGWEYADIYKAFMDCATYAPKRVPIVKKDDIEEIPSSSPILIEAKRQLYAYRRCTNIMILITVVEVIVVYLILRFM